MLLSFGFSHVVSDSWVVSSFDSVSVGFSVRLSISIAWCNFLVLLSAKVVNEVILDSGENTGIGVSRLIRSDSSSGSNEQILRFVSCGASSVHLFKLPSTGSNFSFGGWFSVSFIVLQYTQSVNDKFSLFTITCQHPTNAGC